MGNVRNAKIARAGHGPHSKPTTHHTHADGKAHHHAKGHEPHEHLTSAQRFASRYGATGAPFGKDAPPPPPAATASTGGRAWHHEHAYLTVLLAIVAALALIAVFTPNPTPEHVGPTLAIQPTATARNVIYPPVNPTATRKPTATATPDLRPTPCAVLLRDCATTPVDRFGRSTPDATSERSY